MNEAGKSTFPSAHLTSGLAVRLRQPVLACLGLGSNIAPQRHLAQAVEQLAQALEVVAVSSAWETPAVGSSGPNFLNAAVLVRTQRMPERLKWEVLRPIEARLGRVRTSDKNAPRTIDIDVLVFGGQVLDPKLWQYAHLALPVAELLPELKAEVTGETLVTAAQRLRQQDHNRANYRLALQR